MVQSREVRLLSKVSRSVLFVAQVGCNSLQKWEGSRKDLNYKYGTVHVQMCINILGVGGTNLPYRIEAARFNASPAK